MDWPISHLVFKTSDSTMGHLIHIRYYVQAAVYKRIDSKLNWNIICIEGDPNSQMEFEPNLTTQLPIITGLCFQIIIPFSFILSFFRCFPLRILFIYARVCVVHRIVLFWILVELCCRRRSSAFRLRFRPTHSVTRNLKFKCSHSSAQIRAALHEVPRRPARSSSGRTFQLLDNL